MKRALMLVVLVLGATPGTLDTLIAHATYRIERP